MIDLHWGLDGGPKQSYDTTKVGTRRQGFCATIVKCWATAPNSTILER